MIDPAVIPSSHSRPTTLIQGSLKEDIMFMGATVGVRFRYCVVAILFGTCATTFAQTVPFGRWRAEVGPIPWEVSFNVEGSRLTGTVSSCASSVGAFEIQEGKLDGNTLAFECTSGDGRRHISFAGVIRGSEIALTWELQAKSGDPKIRLPDEALFGSSAPRQFTVKRIPDTPTGVWRVTGVGQTILWEMVLRTDGPRLSGVVSSCSSNRDEIEIFDGKADGRTITFGCQALNRTRKVMLTGKMNGNEITFTWQRQVQNGDTQEAADDALFGPSAPRQFTAKRVPVATLLRTGPFYDHAFVRGSEFSAAVNLVSEDVKAEAKIFIPDGVTRVRVVLMAVAWGVGFDVFNKPRWSELARSIDGSLLVVRFSSIAGMEMGQTGVPTTSEDGRDHALLAVLKRLAAESGHQELNDAPLLFWGHSFAAGVASTFADRFAERTVGFVRFHGGGEPAGNLDVVARIPALVFATSIKGSLWEAGRSDGAPWTLADEGPVGHSTLTDKAADLMVTWIRAVVRQRLSPDGGSLRTPADNLAWLGNNQTGEVAPYKAFSGSKTEANWLPDQAAAHAWQAVLRKK
jgi:hypothetical protein